MRFEVPQFIEMEDKIFGPLSFRQFIYILGGGGIAIVFWMLLPNFLAIILAVPFMTLAGALAFYEINNRRFVFFLESALTFYRRDKLYVWKKQNKKVEQIIEEEVQKKENPAYIPTISKSKLKDLSWSLDVRDKNDPADVL